MQWCFVSRRPGYADGGDAEVGFFGLLVGQEVVGPAGLDVPDHLAEGVR